MSENNESAEEALIRFDERNTSDGLFLRYARGYVAAFPMRLALYLFAASLLGLVTSASLAFTSFAIVLFGDCIHISSLLSDRKISIGKYRCSGMRRDVQRFTAVVHAICASVGVFMVWCATDTGDTRFFAFVCITTLIIHASITMPFFPWGSRLRLTVYCLVLGLLILNDILSAPSLAGDLAFDLIAIALFSAMAVMLMVSRYQGFKKAQTAKRQLLREKLEAEQASNRLIESENLTRQLALVARNASDIVVITEPDGHISWVNDAFQTSTGYVSGDVIGRHIKLLNGPKTDPVVVKKLIQARKSNEGIRTEILNYDKFGNTKWYEISISPVFDDMGILINFVSIERDINAIKQREQDLADARRTAEETARAKTNFLATMSHEIRTPMNGIIGVSDLLLETDLDGDQRHLTETISESAASLLSIINSTLDLTKLDSGRVELENIEFCPGNIALKVVELLRPIAMGKNVDLQFESTDLIPNLVWGDPARFRQILMNLIGNAIKFTSEGRVACELDCHSNADGPYIAARISDSGIGIAPDKLGSIFEEFTQADSSVSRRFGGTGLGLSISRRLARAMGGDINVTSKLGKGSEFTAKLPVKIAGNSQTLEQFTGQSMPVLNGKMVLVADDNKTNRFILSRLLKETGVDLNFATDGFEVVDTFRKKKPDLILMDVSMPGKDGLEATREIRQLEVEQQQETTPIFALTANAFASHRQECETAGMNGFLTKPVKKDVLVGTLSKIFSDRSGNSLTS